MKHRAALDVVFFSGLLIGPDFQNRLKESSALDIKGGSDRRFEYQVMLTSACHRKLTWYNERELSKRDCKSLLWLRDFLRMTNKDLHHNLPLLGWRNAFFLLDAFLDAGDLWQKMGRGGEWANVCCTQRGHSPYKRPETKTRRNDWSTLSDFSMSISIL